MIASKETSCLTPEQLRDVAGGRLPAHRFSQLLEHLDSCPECQRRAEAAVDADDSLATALAAPPESDPYAAEPDCVAALHRAANRRDAAADRSTPPVDQLGPYRLIRPLGSGGMGAVFLAEHTRLRRRCAVKLLPRDRGFDAAWRDRFDREMAAVAALDDPHVVSASDAGEAAGWHYLVMEYLDGMDLSRLAGRLGRLDIADACELVRQTAAGLAHIHASGLVHRDIKPSNLMLTRGGVVKILDLGLVLSGSDPLPSDDRLTTVGHLMGTLAYMAPEQLVDSTTVDHRADLYALGATLYRLLAGVAPHATARGLAPLVIAKTAKGAPSISDHRGDLPGPLVELVTRLLAPDPNRRPQSASEVAAALEPFGAKAHPERLVAAALRRPAPEEESLAPAPLVAPQAAESKQPPRRRRFAALAAAAALPLLLLAGIVITIQTDRGQLVIESDQPGVTVSVEQGEETVEQLQLETGENRVTLRSGTYTVTLDTPADGLQLSDNTAAITRGGETVLRVRREESPATQTASTDTAPNGPRYRGETFDHWLAALENERDLGSVVEAMRAVIAIGRDDHAAERSAVSRNSISFRAAAAVLRAARRYGGMTAAEGENSTPSQRFMNEFIRSFPGLMPNPGIEAISEELAAGNRESAMAAVWVLFSYSMQRTDSSVYRPEPDELERWSDSRQGREKLQKLAENIDRAVDRLGGYELPGGTNLLFQSGQNMRVTMAYQVRLKIDNLLGIDPLEHPAIGGRLRKSITDAAQYHQRLFADAQQPLLAQALPPSTSYELSAEEVDAAAGKVESDKFAWAAVPHLLTSYHAAPEDQHALFEELAEAAPDAAADATITAIYWGLREPIHSMGGGMGDMGAHSKVAYYAGQKKALWQSALEHAAQATSKPQLSLLLFRELNMQMFGHLAVQPQTGELLGVKPGSGEVVRLEPEMRQLYDALQSAIGVLEQRAAAADGDDDSDADGDLADAPTDADAATVPDGVDATFIKYAERIVSRSDGNNDGVLTADEWSEMIMDVAPADADGDGKITMAEYAVWLQARAARTEPQSSTSSSPRYRGQTFGQWLAVLENERDVETIIDAMRAVIALSKDEQPAETPDETKQSDRYRAAAAILRVARRFGGMTAAGTSFGGMRGSSESPSQSFMGEFLQYFPALLPNAGLEAISEELAAGNRESAMAAIWMLSNYATQFHSSTAYHPQPGELARWSESEAGREKLRTLAANLDSAAERLGGYALPLGDPADYLHTAPNLAVSMAYAVRLKINSLLGVDSMEHPAIAARIKANIENAATTHRSLFEEADEPLIPGAVPLDMPSVHALLDEEIQSARGHVDPATLAWAAIPPLLTAHHSITPEEQSALFEELRDNATGATADAAIAAIYRGLPEHYSGRGMGGLGMGGHGGPSKIPTHARENVELWKHALEHAAQHTSRPQLALQLFPVLRFHLSSQFNLDQETGEPIPGADAEPEMTQLIETLQSATATLEERTAESTAEEDGAAEADGEGNPAPADTNAAANVPAPGDAAPSPASNGSIRYHGKTFDEWLAVPGEERDVETVVEAMRGLHALAKAHEAAASATESVDDKRSLAAAAMLLAARRFGGVVAGDDSDSKRFMKELRRTYPALLPNPGLNAISRELREGNRESAMAATWVLNEYANQAAGSTADQPERNELVRWSESNEGREKLRTLSANLDRAVERLGGYQLPDVDVTEYDPEMAPNVAVTAAYRTRMTIEALLRKNSMEDPLVRDRILKTIENAAAYHQRLFAEAEKPLDRRLQSAPQLSDHEIEMVRSIVDPTILAWAAIPHLLAADHATPEPSRILFANLARASPTAAADAVVTAVYRHLPEQTHRTGVRVPKVWYYAHRNRDLWFQTPGFAAASTSKPKLALQVFTALRDHLVYASRIQSRQEARRRGRTEPTENSTTLATTIEQVESAIKGLESRVASGSEPDGDAEVSEADAVEAGAAAD